MKNLILLACVLFLEVSSAYAHLGHESEFWLDEIEKTESLDNYPGAGSASKYFGHGSKEEKQLKMHGLLTK